MRRLRRRIGDSLSAFQSVFRNRDLRQLELAWAASMLGSWAYGIALAVYAYRAGGAQAVGIVGFARWTAGAIASPFAAAISDRVSRKRVMVVASLARAAVLAAGGLVILAGGPALLVYLIAGAVSILSTAFRPAQAALLPSLAASAEELTAANVVSSTIESVGIFGGPALGGALLALTGPGTVFLATAAAVFLAAVLLIGVRPDVRSRGEAESVGSIGSAALEGVTTIVREKRLRLLIGLFAAQTLVDGMLSVLVVVTALRLLDLGDSGVGYLSAALGLGGVLGAFVSAGLVGRRRLAGDFGFGILLWGIPIALIAAWPATVPTLVLLGVVGIGNTLVDVSGMTLLQRAAPEAVLARVFGVLESLILASIALGALVAPALVAWLGVRGALVVAGALLPALVLLSWRTLASVDADVHVPEHQLDLLRRVPMLAPLPPATLERLATSLVPTTLEDGDLVFSRGDPGDRFYVVDDGAVAIESDGRELARLDAGESFGEIALLRDVPRTATARALGETRLYALERNEFIPAVTGHAPSRAAADAVIDARLGPGRAGVVRA
jgi:MFS family permease